MEQVLAVAAKELEQQLTGEVFITREIPKILNFILSKHLFAPREEAEYDKNLKQIIPYVVIRQDQRFFLLRRLKKQTEARLHDRLSLGIGGHINPVDHVFTKSVIEEGMRRELEEEVSVECIRALNCVGILNENTGGVSDYHMGVVYLLEAEGQVQVRETEKMEGSWASKQELEACFSQLETWSQIVLEHLIRPMDVSLPVKMP